MRYAVRCVSEADHIAGVIAPRNPPSARTQALALFASMIGTLQLSRGLADRQLSDAVLEEGVQNALALLGRRRH